MSLAITHTKTNTVPDWTQPQLNTIIAGGAAPLPPAGTLLANVTLTSDWNAAHTISGGGANQVLYTDGSGNMAQSANLTFDGSLETITANGLGVTQNLTKGLKLINTTAATNGAQQISPALHLQAQGFKSGAPTASRPVDWIVDILPIQNSSNPSSRLRFSSSINGGAYTERMGITPTGQFTSTFGLFSSSVVSAEYTDSVGNVFEDDSGVYYPGGYGGGMSFLADINGKLYAPTTLNYSSFSNSSPTNGQTWYDGTHLQFRTGGITYQLDQQGGVSAPVSLANAGWGITNTKTDISTNSTINNQAVASVWLNFNGSSNPTTLTGLVAQTTGTEVVITNNTASGLPYTIVHQNSGSTAANRFDLARSLDLTVPFKSSVRFRYNGTRWNYVGGFITNFPVGSNYQLQLADLTGAAVTTVGGLNWDANNSRLAIPAFAVSGDAQFVGNPRFLQQSTDGTVFFARSSGSDHGYLGSNADFIWNDILSMFTPGNPTSPAARVHSLGNYLTVGDPTSFTATLTLEVLTAVTPTDTLTLVYQPVAPTYYGLIDPTSGLPTDAMQNLGVGGFTCNGQTITGTVYSGRTIGGQSLVDPVGYATSFIDYVNDGTTAFSLTWYWQPQANSDGSTPDFQIFVNNATGFIYYISNGSASTFSDSANDPGSVPIYSPFTGFTASGQMFSYDIAGQADSPSGQPYYSTSANYTITDTVNNGSLFQVQHQIGSASGNWKISQGFNQCQGGANNLTFYQTVTFSNGGDLTPLHYGFLSDGSTLNRDFTITTRNISPLEYYSTGSLDAPTTDNNDGFYYSITYVYNLPAAGQGIRATEDINGGTYTYKDVTGNSGTFYQDALGGHFLGATPTFTPTYRSLPGVIAENTSDDTFPVPQLKLKSTNANARIGIQMYEQNTLKAEQYHAQSGNYNFFNSNGIFDFITVSSSGPTINFKNTSGTVIAGISSAGDITINQINIGDAKNIVLGSSTGTKIGTATSQKLGFYNATPIVQPAGNIVTALSNLGLVGTPTLPASSVSSGAALTKTDDTNVTLTLGGTPTTALLAASSLTLGWTGTLSAARGGTGASTLAGAGIPQVVASNDLTGQSTAVSSITTTTAPNDGVQHTYSVSGYVNVTALTLATVTFQVSFTDETNTAQTLSFFGEGLTTAALSTTGFVAFPPMTIRAKANTAITLKTIATITTSIAYDVGGYILRIN